MASPLPDICLADATLTGSITQLQFMDDICVARAVFFLCYPKVLPQVQEGAIFDSQPTLDGFSLTCPTSFQLSTHTEKTAMLPSR
jgi:hypothetical protein